MTEFWTLQLVCAQTWYNVRIDVYFPLDKDNENKISFFTDLQNYKANFQYI